MTHLMEFNEPLNNSTYFYQRSAELLPPNYYDIDKIKIFSRHEVDSAIEFELNYVGKCEMIHNLNQKGDFKIIGGQYNGKHVDFLGLDNNQALINNWKIDFYKELVDVQRSIKRILAK